MIVGVKRHYRYFIYGLQSTYKQKTNLNVYCEGAYLLMAYI